MNLPAAIFQQHIVALGKTGAGKSYALRGLVERLLDDAKRVCIVDPKGDWWGLKSSATGKSAGYPVVIFGGEHADIPLTQYGGGQVAELVATSNVGGRTSAILDFGGWMVGERTRFWIDFAHGLFKHNRAPLCRTGGAQSNVAIASAARAKGWHWHPYGEGFTDAHGARVLVASEREVFEHVGLPYLEPWERT